GRRRRREEKAEQQGKGQPAQATAHGRAPPDASMDVAGARSVLREAMLGGRRGHRARDGGGGKVKRFATVFASVPGLAAAGCRLAKSYTTFVGARTFLGAPYVKKIEGLQADFAVLGVPFDEGTWGQPGERYGPRDLRESSMEYNHELTDGFFYID